jgi:hypothetical protein
MCDLLICKKILFKPNFYYKLMKSFIISALAVSITAADQVDSLITAIQGVLP